ncbi:MAG TPA: phosphotransferase [Vicinamibacterales bacterium]|nr:phosphotransferase [Vicinamibacterales bacterium]
MNRRAPDDLRERISRFLEETGIASRGVTVVPLTGDASDRRYYRILVRGDATQVLAVHPGPIEFERLPFVNVARLLAAMPVPAPRVIGYSDALGIIALQDLGDVTLQAHLGTATRAEHAALYRQAVALIDTLQRRGAELASPDYVPYGIAFDEEKLTWELQFFTKHFLEAYRGASLTAAEREALAAEYAVIVGELAAEPRVLCHRDYHSRNLMLHDGQLHIIDFQDARMGPDTYDLASLLRDSYVDFTEAQVDELIAFFLALRGSRGAASASDGREFRRRFDLMSLQRNIKALGTFGYQTTTRVNTVYIQYIPRTLSYVRANLERYPRFARLRTLLAAHLEELQ